jgi:hypothetical protein
VHLLYSSTLYTPSTPIMCCFLEATTCFVFFFEGRLVYGSGK